MQIINIILIGLISRLLGGAWNNQIPRRYILPPLFVYMLFACEFNLMQFGAILYLFVVSRLLPTQAFLATCIDNKPPVRDDGRWNFIQRWTSLLWIRFPDKWQLWIVWGGIYGVVRNMLALPAIIYLGGFAWLIFLQGVMYYICGILSKNNGSKYSEILTGAIIGSVI